MVAHDAIGQRVLLAAGAQLQAQALAQIAGADAGRVELLDAPQRALDDLEVLAALEGDLLDRELDVAVVVHVADQHGGDGLLLLVELVHLQLPEQVVGERLAAHQGVLDARPLLVVEVAARRRDVVAVVLVVAEVVFPVDVVEAVVGDLGGGLALRGPPAIPGRPRRRSRSRSSVRGGSSSGVGSRSSVTASSRTGFSSSSSSTSCSSSARDTCRILIACRSWGVMTSCCDMRCCCLISSAMTTGPYRLKPSPRYSSRARRLAAITSGVPSSRMTPPLRIYARSQIPSVSRTL